MIIYDIYNSADEVVRFKLKKNLKMCDPFVLFRTKVDTGLSRCGHSGQTQQTASNMCVKSKQVDAQFSHAPVGEELLIYLMAK